MTDATGGGGVLVTGANGHLGRRLLTRLLATPGGSPVRALVRSERAAEQVRALPIQPELVVAEWSDEPALTRATQGVAAIAHTVGILKQTARARYETAHEETATRLGRAAAKAGVARIVYPSILGADPGAANACLASKGRAERILLECGVPTTVIRLPMVLGEGELALHALRGWLRAARVPLVRGGRSLEQPIDAEDVAAAVLAALRDRSGACHTLDLGGPESLPRHELLARAAAAAGRPMPRVLPLPLAVARAFAALGERLAANPPLTRAMLEVLEHDDCVDAEPACRALGIRLTPLDETLRRCLAAEKETA